MTVRSSKAAKVRESRESKSAKYVVGKAVQICRRMASSKCEEKEIEGKGTIRKQLRGLPVIMSMICSD